MGACFTMVSYCFIWVSYGYLPHHTGASLTWVPHQSHTLKISRLFHRFGACPIIQVPNHIGSISISVSLKHSKSVASFHMAAWFISIMGVCHIKQAHHMGTTLVSECQNQCGLVSNGYPQPVCLFHMGSLPRRCLPHTNCVTKHWLLRKIKSKAHAAEIYCILFPEDYF